jgi:O-antigen/teichoic acid export membrane protein
MIKNSSIALKSGVWYIVCNFLVKGIGLLTTPFFTRLMSTSDVGSFSNIMSWVGILTIITTFDLYSSIPVARFDFENNIYGYITSCLIMGTIITSVFYSIAIIFRGVITTYFSIDLKTLHLIFIYCIVYPAIQMLQIHSRMFYKYKASVAITLVSTIFSVLLSLLLVIFMSDKLWGRTLGYYIPLIIIGIVVYIYFLTKSRKLSLKYCKYALRISFPLIWHTLSCTILNSGDRIMITYFCGKTDNAFYSIASSSAMIVSVLWASMNNAWSPWAYERMNQKQYSTIRKASIPYSIFFGFVVFAFMLLAPEVILIMGGSKYKEAVPVVPPIMVGYVYQFIYSFYVNIEFYHKKQKYIAFATILATIVNIVLNAIFIPICGYEAAAYTTLVGYIVLFLTHFYIVGRMKKLSWYNTKFNIIFLASFSALIPIMLLLYKITWLRYFLIIFIVFVEIILCIIFGKTIFTSLKQKSIEPITEKIKLMKNRRISS